MSLIVIEQIFTVPPTQDFPQGELCLRKPHGICFWKIWPSIAFTCICSFWRTYHSQLALSLAKSRTWKIHSDTLVSFYFMLRKEDENEFFSLKVNSVLEDQRSLSCWDELLFVDDKWVRLGFFLDPYSQGHVSPVITVHVLFNYKKKTHFFLCAYFSILITLGIVSLILNSENNMDLVSPLIIFL